MATPPLSTRVHFCVVLHPACQQSDFKIMRFLSLGSSGFDVQQGLEKKVPREQGTVLRSIGPEGLGPGSCISGSSVNANPSILHSKSRYIFQP